MGTSERRAREFQEREEKIIQKAIELFLKHEVHAVSTDMIVQAMEISRGTLYNHFRTKDEIYARILIQFYEEGIEKLSSIDDQLPLLEQIREMANCYFQSYLATPRLHTIIDQCERYIVESNLDVQVIKKIEFLRNRKMEITKATIQRTIDQELFVDIPVEYVNYAGWAMLYGAFSLYSKGVLDHDPAIDPMKFLKLVPEILIQSIRLSNSENRLTQFEY